MDPALRQELIQAVGRAWTHPANSHKVMDPDLAMAVVEEVEALFDRWAANASRTGHPLVPPDPGERGNSDSGAVMTTGQSCGSCRAFSAYKDGPELGECRRHPPVLLADADSCQSLWPEVGDGEFCCEWLPQPVTQTPLVETPR